MKELIITLLIVVSGVCWSVVYIDSILTGFKQKTYCMPLFALGLNIAWEGIYACTDLFVRGNIGAQAIANTVGSCWTFLLSLHILNMAGKKQKVNWGKSGSFHGRCWYLSPALYFSSFS